MTARNEKPRASEHPLADAYALMHHFEGCRLRPYICPAGLPTIGWGHVILPHEDDLYGVASRDPVKFDPTFRLAQEAADALFQIDTQRFIVGVHKRVKVQLTAHQLGALVSFAYNAGLSALGSSTLLKCLNRGNYTAAAEQFERWVYGGGKILPGLVRRRKAERALFEGMPEL